MNDDKCPDQAACLRDGCNQKLDGSTCHRYAEATAEADLPTEHAVLQLALLREQVRELRLKNDAQEMANQHLSKPLPDMLSMYKKDA